MGKPQVKNYKSINFDLDTNSIKQCIANGVVKFKDYTAAYGRIRRFLERAGFNHDQGSGYVSKAPMSKTDAELIFVRLGSKHPWLAQCFSVCRLTSFNEKRIARIDLIPFVQAGAQGSTKGSGLLFSPITYKPVKDEPKINEALKTSLKKTNIKPSSPVPAQGAAAASKPVATAKTKALIKSKSYGK